MTTLLPHHLRAILDLWPLIEARRAYAERRTEAVWRLATCHRETERLGSGMVAVSRPGVGYWPPIGDWRDQMPPPQEWIRAVERGWSIRLAAPDWWRGDSPAPDEMVAGLRVGVGDV